SLVRPKGSPLSIKRIQFRAQVMAQVMRGLCITWRDKPLLALLAGQPLVVGVLINLSQLRPDGLAPMFLFAVVTAIWLGLNNTAREVVRDRKIYVRERLLGVTPEGYLVAKVILFGAIGFVQLILLVLILRFLNFLTAGDALDLAAWSPVYVLLILWVTYWAGMLLGLLVSTLASTQ